MSPNISQISTTAIAAPSMNDWLTIKEVAYELRCSLSTARRLILKYQIRDRFIGGRHFYCKADIQQLFIA